MVNRAIRLSECIAEYMASAASHGDKDSTLRSKHGTLDKLLNDKRTGNILMRNIRPEHIDSVFESMHRDGLRPSSINLHRANLVTFFRWCQQRRYISATSTPMAGTRMLKCTPRQRIMVPVGKFAHLLDSAEHPRDRALVSLGLFLFLRQSEIRSLTIGDVDLDGGWVEVHIHKTSQRDVMPISMELDRELRRWLTWYSGVAGSLQPGWSLIPARQRPVMVGRAGHRGFMDQVGGTGVNPTKPLVQIERPVQEALVKAGFHIWDETGKLNFEGAHTLRRSGARARFDELVEAGHDGAIRQVQAMLHHSSIQMTERYLGLTLDVDRRDKSIRGKAMYPSMASAKVVSLPARRA